MQYVNLLYGNHYFAHPIFIKKVRDDLFAFMKNPKVEPTNNIAERSIKPFVIQRKTFMTSGSYDGAKITAVLFSIIRTAKINMVDTYDYLIFLKNSGKILVTDFVPYFINEKI